MEKYLRIKMLHQLSKLLSSSPIKPGKQPYSKGDWKNEIIDTRTYMSPQHLVSAS